MRHPENGAKRLLAPSPSRGTQDIRVREGWGPPMLVPRSTPPSLKDLALSSRPGFTSFKTREAVRYPRRWHRDALVQMTLDPAVEAIGPSPDPHRARDGLGFVFQVGYDGRPVLIGLHETAPVGQTHGAEIVGVPIVPLTRREVLQEPRASAARVVWAARNVTVAAGDRVRVLGALADAGDGLELAALAALVREPAGDPVEAILALVCSGVLVMDVGQGLAPESIVRRPGRRAGATAPSCTPRSTTSLPGDLLDSQSDSSPGAK